MDEDSSVYGTPPSDNTEDSVGVGPVDDSGQPKKSEDEATAELVDTTGPSDL